MGASDYYRPSVDQINNHYECTSCGATTESPSCYGPPDCCGREMAFVGESYPADANEWNEQKDPDGEWRERRW